ncbi:hypothetical protein D2V17_08300 [Aurantiacibacter xanthus]|uniref:Uncharacterized protein n=1 Tax=Aurantiacibacter xanthus TaxID=1784712 RepID=A0A3A1P6B8_9SPHN|nr:hypothetical protein [Aurantiacibacter xanthus]RIV87386.1 hypothetical protein D2V17_08300 [Aurantiacibacter xanthus]
MLRRLLTLLAVMSGFALVAEPARAVEAGVVSMAEAADSGDCSTIVAAPLELSAGKAARVPMARPCAGRPVVVWSPTVQLQADRALE